MSSDFDTSVLVDDFIEEATGHLDAVERSLLALEKRTQEGVCDKGIVNLILGDLHTLKGNAGMMGFVSLQRYVHRIESVFKEVSDESLSLSPQVFETFYGAVSALRRGLTTLADAAEAPQDFSDELMALELVLTSVPTVAERERPQAPAVTGGMREEYTYITQKSTTLKVNFEKLDELLNLVGELVIHRTTLVNIGNRLREKVTDRELLDLFNESSQLIGKSSTELRESIMKVRMLPVGTVFQKFQRLVRDLSQRHGKDVHLRFEGEETELDKTVIDEIGEPLLHLIRNAVDHGIESPTERRGLGKPSAGTLILRASHESNHIVISVVDDGRGMAINKIRGSAVAKGLLPGDAAAAMTDAEVLQLVFLPGFSTSSELTETSGRGIGLDVVKKIVNSFNGNIEIHSNAGSGTTFTIKLPLTLAIINALMVEVCGETYAIPLAGVLESIRVGRHELHGVGGGEMINLRDRLLPIHRLDRFFGGETSNVRDQDYVVVVGSGEKRGGLVVDRLLGQQEIVIKALDDYLGDLPGISGVTVLGDGSIAMIVDISSILDTTKDRTRDRTFDHIVLRRV